MLVRGALTCLRAQIPSTAARDFALLSRQLRRTLLSATNGSIAAPVTAAAFPHVRAYAASTRAKSRAATTKKAPAKKTTATKTAPKKKAAATKKAAPKKKAAAKPKKKVLTAEQKERLEARKERAKERAVELKAKDRLKLLKEKALREPKGKPATVFSILAAEQVKQELEGKKSGITASFTQAMQYASQKYKNLSASELEHYNRLANEAKQANEAAYKKWVQSYTPAEIREANLARQQLKLKLETYNKPPIKDDRRVASPKTPYIMFYSDRFATGDFNNMNVKEATRLAGQEWKALSDSEKKKYFDLAAADKQRYAKEFKAIYGEEAPFVKAAHA